MIDYCNNNFNKVIISTGTSSEEELENLKKNLKNENYIFLHCVSAYPCDPSIANLKRINFIKKLSKEYGYSDHTPGIEVAKISLEFGISYLEKHFTVDNNLPGRDNKFAILPEDLKNFKEYLNLKHKANIFHGNDFLKRRGRGKKYLYGQMGIIKLENFFLSSDTDHHRYTINYLKKHNIHFEKYIFETTGVRPLFECQNIL